MSYKDERKTDELRIYGYFPKDYEYSSLRNAPITSETVWNNFRNEMTCEKELEKLMKNFEIEYSASIATAKKIRKEHLLKSAVESAYRMQLEILYPHSGAYGIPPEISYLRHCGRYFLEYLRDKNKIKYELSMYGNKPFVVMPTELEKELESVY